MSYICGGGCGANGKLCGFCARAGRSGRVALHDAFPEAKSPPDSPAATLPPPQTPSTGVPDHSSRREALVPALELGVAALAAAAVAVAVATDETPS
jgi:hypothetical protein